MYNLRLWLLRGSGDRGILSWWWWLARGSSRGTCCPHCGTKKRERARITEERRMKNYYDYEAFEIAIN